MAPSCMASMLQALCCSWLMMLLLFAASTSSLEQVVVLDGSAVAPLSGFRLELTHVDSMGNFTMSQLLQRAAHRSRVRAAKLSATLGRGGGGGGASTVSASAASATSWDTRPSVHWSLNEYVVELQIGTPPVPFMAMVETGSDLIWTQSRPCTRCAYQPTPVYDRRSSRSFSPEPCNSAMCQPPPARFNQLDYNCIYTSRPQLCTYSYNNTLGAFSKGVMGRETLTFPASGGGSGSRPAGGGVSFSGVAFGCGHENTGRMFNSTGTLGLGRGPLSLLAQLGIGKFSYCLTDYFLPRRTSPLLFGSLADLTPGGVGGAGVQSTPLYQNPLSGTLYYVTLQGISMGQTRLPIPDGTFDVQNDGTGGVVFDSSLPYTLLEENAFVLVATYVQEILDIQQGGSFNGSSQLLDAPCYPLSKGDELPAMPDMVLHFDEGADMVLHRDNYMILHKEHSEMCLAMAPIQGISVIGNFQQQNMHLLFDIIEGYVSFVPADCSKL